MAEHRLDAAVITVNGRALPTDLYRWLQLVCVEESVHLPDSFELRFEDPHFSLFDEGIFTLGDRLEVALRADADPVVVTTAEVTAIAVEQSANGRHELVVSGFDLAHRLTQGPKRRSFQAMTDADIARTIASEYSLEADVDASGGAVEHIMQFNETDRSFLRRRAARIGFDFWVTNQTLHFKRKPHGEEAAPALRWGENLLAFRVRFSATERCDEVVTRGWDPLGKRSVTGHAREPDTGTDAPAAGQMRDAARNAYGTVQRFATQFPVSDQSEADALAQSLMMRASGDEVILRGEAIGNPLIGAGVEVGIERVGSRLSGRYQVTSVIHLYGAHRPYVTRFTCGGKEPRSLVDVLGRTATGLLGGSGTGLLIGQVTNIDDPEKLCRVRVKFPTVTEDDESTWARVLSPGAGSSRGLQWLPEVNDEVLVGFELGDPNRPVVLGGLWSRTDTPPEPSIAANGSVNARMLVSRKNHRLTFTDDSDSSLELSLGDAACLLRLKKSASSLAGEEKLVITARQIEIKATESLLLEGNKVAIKATGELSMTGKPINLN